MPKHLILAIVGPSGAGKTTIALAMRDADIPTIVSYTTRPMRPGEADGREHLFVSEEQADTLIAGNRVVAYTTIGGYRYFALQGQFEQHEVMTYVVDEAGLIMLNHFTEVNPDFACVPVYVMRSADDIAASIDPQRIGRDKERQRLPIDTYNIVINNTSPCAASLAMWAHKFADAVRLSHIADSLIRVDNLYLSTRQDPLSRLERTINKNHSL